MTASPTSKYATLFVFITVFLDMVGFGMIIPVQPAIIQEVGKMDLAHAAYIGGWLFFAFSMTQFLFGPALGNLSDAYGRRPLLLIAVFGLGVDFLITALAPNLFWLFVGRTFAGLCGGSYVIANAYIADVTPPEGRAKAFGLMGAAFGMGFVIGPAIGGLLGAYGPRIPFYVAAGVSLLNFVFGYFVVPETLKAELRRPFEWARANPIKTFAIFQNYRGVMPLCGVLFIYFFSTAVYPAIWPFWSMAKFGWGATMIGLTLAMFGIVMAFTQGVLTGPVVKRLGEWNTALLGLVVTVIGALGYGLAPTLGAILALMIVHGGEGFVHPMVSALISKQVPDDAQGELQGGLSSLMSVAMLLGTVFFSQIFGYFMSGAAGFISPNVPMFVSAFVSVFALVLFAMTSNKEKTAE
ncbi:MAG: TCR/Tet family MFS transporter [Alphaproteobacteria bacterium]|nr:TCR/Tet family MFS transporter [Alphaproteobacteria bacterium]